MDSNSFEKYKCPCCGCHTLDKEADNTFQICPICCWEDDGVQLHDPYYTGGANNVRLVQARENFKLFGTVEGKFEKDGRPALDGNKCDG